MKKSILLFSACIIFCQSILNAGTQTIPLPEHPRPDFERPVWQNLNGPWQFEFDNSNAGMDDTWFDGKKPFSKEITVPFPWGSKLSRVADEADIGWYKRQIKVDQSWKGKRIFITIGASDWKTTVWLDGNKLGSHKGGYVPFSFELTDNVQYNKKQTLVIRADDKRRDFTLYGKQGYGNARGIWQTVYLEARGQTWLEAVHFTPDIDSSRVHVTAYLDHKAKSDLPVTFKIKTEAGSIESVITLPKGRSKGKGIIDIPNARLWTLDDPYLYDVDIKLKDDNIRTYFGMRKISVVNLPHTGFPYIALNDKPVYLQLALDQSYHPDGFYTFPSDQFMREEIQRSKEIGLNGIRPHIKVEIPRKLYWADKLGLLVMQDLPNSWGEPDEKMQAEAEYTLREMIRRDYNHPSIFSWIVFNETWGLFTHVANGDKTERHYLPETQYWVAAMTYLAKSLDPSRLVEDNSICCGRGHTETDINSFHVYLPGWEWDNYLKNVSDNIYPGSPFQFEEGFAQGRQPVINSECGNVWGYEGSTGDVDWSYDYHRMINTFRQYPKIAGWLYTEHHDVINEWNGYWRFDRSEKFTGVEEILPGMTVSDFHAPVYISSGNDICLPAEPGEQTDLPLFISSMTDADFGDQLTLETRLTLTDAIGETHLLSENTRAIDYLPYMNAPLEPLTVTLPKERGLVQLSLILKDTQGSSLHHNFMHFVVEDNKTTDSQPAVSLKPGQFSSQQWSLKQWDVLNGLKVNGAGKGYFEYTFDLPESIQWEKVKNIYFTAELSAKQLFVKDMDKKQKQNVDFMRGARVDASSNPNAYPMTDEITFPSEIVLSANGRKIDTITLPDDPADHRGVLSWHAQLNDRKLREAGSYGYLKKVKMPKDMVSDHKITIRLETRGEGGLAVYGKSFGRYPVDPSILIEYK